MEPMHDPYGKSDHERHLDTLKSPAERGERPFLMTGTHAKEWMVSCIIIGGCLGGFLTRNVWGAVIGALLVFGGWFIVRKAFGGQFMATYINPSRQVRWGLIGGAGGFAGAFAAGFAGLSIPLIPAIVVGVLAGVGYYRFVLAKRGR